METLATPPPGQRFREGPQGVARIGGHRLESLGADALAAEMLGERDHAELDGGPLIELEAAVRRRVGRASQTSSVEPPPMSKSSALLGSRVSEIAAAARGEARLGLAVDDLEIEPGALERPGGEFVPVRRRAAGLSRDKARARHAARLHLVAANLQRVERAFDRRLADAAVAAEALPKAHDAREGVDDPQGLCRPSARPPLWAGDQEAAVVGAEIERGINMLRCAARYDARARPAMARAICVRPRGRRRYSGSRLAGDAPVTSAQVTPRRSGCMWAVR